MNNNIKKATLLTLLSLLVVTNVAIRGESIQDESSQRQIQRNSRVLEEKEDWNIIEDTKTTDEIYYNYDKLSDDSYQVFGIVTDTVSNDEGVLITATSFDENGELDDNIVTFYSSNKKFRKSFDTLKIQAGDTVIIEAKPDGYVDKINPVMKASNINKIDFSQ